MTATHTQAKQACQMLERMTRGTFAMFHMAGDSRSTQRQELMQALTGQKLPKAKCGITALQSGFYSLAQANGWDKPRDCIAVTERSFEAWAETVAASATQPETVPA